MHVTKVFEVNRSRDVAIEVLDRDETLPRLFPGRKVEVVRKEGDRKTIEAEYRALGQEGIATFHFDFLMDGSIRFQKVCDGNVWRTLRGEVEIDELDPARARVQIEMEGHTKGLVPEFTIKGPLRDQLEEMARALRDEIEDAPGS
ncbi:MAG: hypothetical protein QNK05_13565 [Myxococcota bacterium]|nr:hypothetical protein [Myxococcota bacterium]